MADGTLRSSSLENILKEIFAEQNITSYLQKVLPGSQEGENFLSSIHRIHIDGLQNASTEIQMDLIVKKVPKSQEMRKNIALEIMYERELWAYTNVLPSLYELQTIHSLPYEDMFHCVKLYKGKDETLVMEDLCSKDFKLREKTEPIDINHLVFSMKNLARYHACSFVLSIQNPILYKTLVNGVCRKHEYWSSLDIYLDKLRAPVLAMFDDDDSKMKIENVFEGALNDFEFFLNSEESAPFNVICHGDCWTNNFLFSYKNGEINEMRMVDWQSIRLGSPVTDIAYLIFSSTDRKTRSQYYETILDLYYETLSLNCAMMGINLSECYPENVYREQIRRYMRYGLIIAIMILPITLGTKDELPTEISDVVVKTEDGGPPMIFSNDCSKRMKEVIEDFINDCYNI